MLCIMYGSSNYLPPIETPAGSRDQSAFVAQSRSLTTYHLCFKVLEVELIVRRPWIEHRCEAFGTFNITIS